MAFWVVLGLVGVVGIGGGLLRALNEKPDEHFVRARKMLDDYELARPETTRDYAAPVYRNALSELALVDPGSISADPARELYSEIQDKVKAFARRVEERQAERDRRLERLKQRDAVLLKRVKAQRNHPDHAYPECED